MTLQDITITTQDVILAQGAADPEAMLKDIVRWVVLPVLGIMGGFAVKNGKFGALIAIIIGGLVMLAFAFGDITTWEAVGKDVASFIRNMLDGF